MAVCSASAKDTEWNRFIQAVTIKEVDLGLGCVHDFRIVFLLGLFRVQRQDLQLTCRRVY